MSRLFALLLAVALTPLAGQPLPGTGPLTAEGDLARAMVDGIHRYLDRALEASVEERERHWRRDYSSREAYERSVETNRKHFRRYIGAVEERVGFDSPGLVATLADGALVAETAAYEVLAVRWPAFGEVHAEGLLLRPKGPVRARVVALPDADSSPEAIAGLAPGLPPEAQFARRLAESGCLVLVPVLIDRGTEFSGSPVAGRWTNQPHREFIYRMAYEMGRHAIGYEVEKVLAAVDWFAAEPGGLPIGVAGHGEGGLIALYSAAADTRIGAAAVSGYFESREQAWREAIYRTVWRLLSEFGDAGIASLIAPRTLIVIDEPGPQIAGPPPETADRRGAASGRLAGPDPAGVKAEVERARVHFSRLGGRLELVPRGSQAAGWRAFAKGLGVDPAPAGAAPEDRRRGFDPKRRLERQFRELVAHTQRLVQISEFRRKEFFAKADASSVDAWQRTAGEYRRYLWEEAMGKLPAATEPLAARTRKIHDEARWTGYEVVIPVWRDVDAYGTLLVPKDLEPGERRPVVVTQHGLEDRPQYLVKPENERKEQTYKRYAATLADRGFVVYAPQNPYIFEDHFRQIMRKANPLGWSLFSFIIGQHERTLDWLAGLPFVDPARIGFYGLSYGGKTAMRVPSLLERYALSICSADFNEWIAKITSADHPFSYMFTREYDMLEFDLGNTFNYSEMAMLIAPRPFMVERGHNDGVGIDEWVAHEYARVRRFYNFLGIGDRTAIEFFNGPHQIHGEGTFEFLHRHLRWPARR